MTTELSTPTAGRPLPQPPGIRGPARHRDLLRGCLQTWHGIAKGHRLDRGERAYVVEVIGRWIDRELATSIEGRDPGSAT
jgi:hypothetical protein